MVVITRADGENYRFDRLYSVDLDMARQACDLVATQVSKELQHPLLRDAVITYCRPFSGNQGIVFRTHRLPRTIVPIEMLSLHDELQRVRNKVFAHSDHDYLKPQIARIPQPKRPAAYPMGFSVPPYDDLILRISEIRGLVVAVAANVDARAREFEAKYETFWPEVEAPIADDESTDLPGGA